MRRATLRWILIVAAAVLLHLPAHFAPWSDKPSRELLPEDGPQFLRSEALVAGPDEGVFATVRRAVSDPSAEWSEAPESVGASRWRPVSTALFVAERSAPWAGTQESAAEGAAIVSLLLHVAVALGAARLARNLGGDSRAEFLTGLLVAASPAALVAAAWPARQAAVLATALALGGTLVAQRGGAFRLFVAGGILALAGLSHEFAFGWVVAVLALRVAEDPSRGRAVSSWPLLVLPVAAFLVRRHMLGGLGAIAEASAGAPNAVDGLAGMVRTLFAFAVPAQVHFADGPYAFPFLAHVAALGALVFAAAFLLRRRSHPAARTAIAAVAALFVIPAALAAGVGIAPYQDSYLYLVLPLLAASAGLAFADASQRAGPVRIAAAAAAGLLVAASVAATAARAPSFRTRAGIVELAKSGMPASPVVRIWDIADRAGKDERAFKLAGTEIVALATELNERGVARLRADAVSAATVSRFFSDYASRTTVSKFDPTDAAFDAADTAGAVATSLRPKSWRTWAVLASLRRRTGDVRGMRDAVAKALELAPDNVGVVQMAAEVMLTMGESRSAADLLEKTHEQLRADPAHPPVTSDFLMLYARALSADGALRVPDPLNDRGLRYRYDIAADVLVAVTADMPDQRGTTSPANRLLHDVYLRYGDMLATVDRTAMALEAYKRAIERAAGNPTSTAAEHRGWLLARLAKALAAAEARVTAAQLEPGMKDIGNALVDLYIAYCRSGDLVNADGVFAKLEGALGGVSPELRYRRAVERYAARERDEDQSLAEKELKRVLEERPTLVRARYELARVLEWQGTVERLAEAKAQYERAAVEGALEDWSLDALDRAKVLGEFLKDAGK